MKRRSFLRLTGLAGLAAGVPSAAGLGSAEQHETKAAKPAVAVPNKTPASPETILLKDYRPKSIYKIPVTEVLKARYPVIDMHSHL